MADPVTKKRTLKSIESVVLGIIRRTVMTKTPPTLKVPRRNPKTGAAEDLVVSFGSRRQRPHFTIIIHTLDKIYNLLSTNRKCTMRDLYYDNFIFYKDQRCLNTAVTEISLMLKVDVFDTNIEFSAKGLIAGSLSWVGESNEVCSLREFHSKGMLISTWLLEIKEFKSNAKFILFIEKDAIFQQLLASNVFDALGDCILITGKGYADRVTRRALSKLSKMLKVPTFALVDADPYGIDIAANIKWGSLSQECLKELENEENQTISIETVPNLIWLGIRPSDISELAFPERVLADLTLADEKKLKALRKRAADNNEHEWVKQITHLSNLSVKAEIEAVNFIPGFLCYTYLRSKIRDYLENSFNSNHHESYTI